MTPEPAFKPVKPRDRWALLPVGLAEAVLRTLYDALDRKPPFDDIPLSAFDVAVRRVPPPLGLTREQFRRAVFEEMNALPWSDGLEPPEGHSWLRLTPIETTADRVFFFGPDMYRFKRKAADGIVARMKSDGLLRAETAVFPKGDLHLLDAVRSDIRFTSSLFVRYSIAPSVQATLTVADPIHQPPVFRPEDIFMDPDIRFTHSDESAEHSIRQIWRWASALFEAVRGAIAELPPESLKTE